ncbi:MAG: L-histidine N(alpha)-methyltransferase [Bacteroidota bacterium]
METTTFLEDVDRGLSSSPKYLSSKYFYDDQGDKIFQQIMELDEYYLTKSEYEVFEQNKDQILEAFKNGSSDRFQLLEFGAGDGYKTKVLLRYFLEMKVDFTYLPIDISSSVLKGLEESLLEELPGLSVCGVAGDYFKVLKKLGEHQDSYRNVVLFLGANIGNFPLSVSKDFFNNIRKNLGPKDLFLVGFDLKKDPRKILNAYNDDSGVTSSFNLNLLSRINKELGGNFQVENFEHYPVYDPLSGECKSYLMSLKDQVVTLNGSDKTYHFDKWEPVYMEVSRKFSYREIEQLGMEAGFVIVDRFTDSDENFVDVIFQPNS